MSRFKFKLKLQGLELEVEGNRDDASLIGRNLGDQISSLLAPTLGVIEGEAGPALEHSQGSANAATAKSARKGRKKTSVGSTATGGDKKPDLVIPFVNDPSKFSTPTQSWNTAKKSIWLLYAVKELAKVDELSSGQIVKTFNTHFRQAGQLTNSNVSRDLGKAKIASPALVGEDTTKPHSPWFLTEEGVRQAQKLISESLAAKSE